MACVADEDDLAIPACYGVESGAGEGGKFFPLSFGDKGECFSYSGIVVLFVGGFSFFLFWGEICG